MAQQVRYLVFDVESVVDGDLVAQVRYSGERLTPKEAVASYESELQEDRGSAFIPYTYHIPVAVVVAKVTADFRLADLISLDAPQFRPKVLAKEFWRIWEANRRPTLVTFNGRTFDLPVLELAAFRYGLSVPGWFNITAKSFEQSRNRFNLDAHVDLQEVLTNFGASRFPGGLNLAARLLAKPGKMDVDGSMVQSLYDENRLDAISDYCCGDVLDTYFVFLRTQVLLGKLSLDEEQGIVGETKEWITHKAAQWAGLRKYLEHWGGRS